MISNNSTQKEYFPWFICIFLILFLSIRTIIPELNDDFHLRKIIHYSYLELKINQFINTNLIFKFIKLLIQFFVVLFPIIGITLIEYSKVRGNFKERLSSTSIGKIRLSEGFYASELWFYFLPKILFRIPLLLTLVTFSINNLSNPLQNSILSFYKNILPIPTNITAEIAFILIFAFILLDSLAQYLNHLLSHKIPIFWELHEFHHASSEMVVLNTVRENPLLRVIQTIISLPISVYSLILLTSCLDKGFSMPIYLYIAYTFIDYFNNYLGHSSLYFVYPKPLSYILLSPSLHWIHHSNNENHYDKNFGRVFTFWDIIFGTYLDESHIKDISGFGIKNTQYNKYHPLFSYFLLPILKIKRRIKNA